MSPRKQTTLQRAMKNHPNKLNARKVELRTERTVNALRDLAQADQTEQSQ